MWGECRESVGLSRGHGKLRGSHLPQPATLDCCINIITRALPLISIANSAGHVHLIAWHEMGPGLPDFGVKLS